MVAGIEVHKHTHAAALLDERGVTIDTLGFANTPDGMRRLQRWLVERGAGAAVVGGEMPAGYGRLLVASLEAASHVGEVAFEGASCFAWCFAFGELAGQVGACWWVVAGLDDRDSVEGGVELAGAAAVDAVAARGLSGVAGDRCGAAEAGEGDGVAEAADVAMHSEAGSTTILAADRPAASAAKPLLSAAYTRSTGTTSSGPTPRPALSMPRSSSPGVQRQAPATSRARPRL